jgi:hypothetical protein
LYGAWVAGAAAHFPLESQVPSPRYAVAVPSMKYSFSEYPYCCSRDAGMAFTGMSG